MRRVEVYLQFNRFVERRRVEPLQIVEEHRERVFRPREHVDEAPGDKPGPVLSVLRFVPYIGNAVTETAGSSHGGIWDDNSCPEPELNSRNEHADLARR